MREWPTLAEAEEAADLMCDKEDKKPNSCDDQTCQRACWIVHGYCASQCYMPGMHARSQGGLEGREALNAIRSEKGNAMKAMNINWFQLAQFVLQMIVTFMAQVNPPAPPAPPQQAPPQTPPQAPQVETGVPNEPREPIREP